MGKQSDKYVHEEDGGLVHSSAHTIPEGTDPDGVEFGKKHVHSGGLVHASEHTIPAEE